MSQHTLPVCVCWSTTYKCKYSLWNISSSRCMSSAALHCAVCKYCTCSLMCLGSAEMFAAVLNCEGHRRKNSLSVFGQFPSICMRWDKRNEQCLRPCGRTIRPGKWTAAGCSTAATVTLSLWLMYKFVLLLSNSPLYLKYFSSTCFVPKTRLGSPRTLTVTAACSASEKILANKIHSAILCPLAEMPYARAFV